MVISGLREDREAVELVATPKDQGPVQWIRRAISYWTGVNRPLLANIFRSTLEIARPNGTIQING